ncbi:RNA-binding, RBD [Glarea lozoyensis ATCC 20868]|uniref:RNA-binding, RBD n=1 Tax=Glarea lozoyensis (strain ATCC 20868 / MF5171) TaxID=1116229 RepID=S3CHP9_GLAL2|nr:RNA-binding, RBD [Glarea lozoyensis ATCC 20868]EPE26002.1 RNA-binding, RBD [Glarea lozoyensis ATCC 20868]
MKQRFRNLPSERHNGHTPIPPYIANQNQLSTDSNDSQDSVLTQVPMSYHMANSFAPQQNSTDQAVQNAQFTQQNFHQGDQSGGVSGISSKPLNPTSSEFSPQGSQFWKNSSPQMPSTPSTGYNGQRSGQPQGRGQKTNPQTNLTANGQIYAQHQYKMAPSQISSAHFYSNNQAGSAQDTMSGSGYQYNSIFGAPAGSYQYSGTSASAMNAYQSQNRGHQPPALGAAFSHGPSFVQHNAARGASEVGPARGGNAGETGARGEVGQNSRNFPNQNALAYGNFSQRSGQDFTYGARSGMGAGFNGEGHKSNMAAVSVSTYPDSSRGSYSSGTGGPVRPHVLRDSSPDRSMTSSNLSHHSRSIADTASANPSSHSAQGDSITRGPTPGEQSQPLNLEFSSEPRGIRTASRNSNQSSTPDIRPRRRQSTVSLSSDTLRRHTETWDIAKTLKGLDVNDKTEDMKRHNNPPKMINLLAAGGITSGILSPITEGQGMYASAPPVRSLDPFGPTPSMSSPYSGSTSLAPVNNMSNALRALTANGSRKPSVEEALLLNNLPFIEMCRTAKVDTWGVVKIKNIPYSVNRAEVMAFLGRNARLINETDYEPIHIVMERVTSKTLDCYVEFVNFNEAVAAVNRFEGNRIGGRSGRLGQRHVEVELSSQEALMKELFPKAKNVTWRGARPEIAPRDPNDKYNSGFQGFVSKEELVMLVKHVEAPQRSPFSKDCPQRPFECLISTLLKYPWYMVEYITIEDRNLIHQTTKELLTMLVERVHNERDPVNLTHMLLKRVCRAALRCPGFTPIMKDDIVYIAGLEDRLAIEAGVPPFAYEWKVLWTIGPKPGVPNDLLLWYIAIIREATEEAGPVLSLAQRAATQQSSQESPKLFGNLEKHIQRRPGLAHQTLAEVAETEWAAIEKVLIHALTPRIEQ